MGHQGTMAAPFSRRTETVASQISLTAAASENIEQHHPRVSSSLLHPTVFSHVCSHCNMFKLFGFRTSLQGVFCGIRSCPWHDLGLYMAVRCRLGSSHCHWHFLGMDASSLSTPQHSSALRSHGCAMLRPFRHSARFAILVFGAGHPAINYLLLLAIADDALGMARHSETHETRKENRMTTHRVQNYTNINSMHFALNMWTTQYCELGKLGSRIDDVAVQKWRPSLR